MNSLSLVCRMLYSWGVCESIQASINLLKFANSFSLSSLSATNAISRLACWLRDCLKCHIQVTTFFLSDEYAHFDGKFNCVKGIVTIGLHIYHPLLRNIIRIASMDSDAEDTEAVGMFFTYVNRAMQFISGDEFATFNPIGFCCDGMVLILPVWPGVEQARHALLLLILAFLQFF